MSTLLSIKAKVYLNTKAGSFPCALSCSMSFGKFFMLNSFPDEGIPSSIHSLSIKAFLFTKVSFNA